MQIGEGQASNRDRILIRVALETDVKSVRKIPLKHLREPVLNRLFDVEIDHLADQFGDVCWPHEWQFKCSPAPYTYFIRPKVIPHRIADAWWDRRYIGDCAVYAINVPVHVTAQDLEEWFTSGLHASDRKQKGLEYDIRQATIALRRADAKLQKVMEEARMAEEKKLVSALDGSTEERMEAETINQHVNEIPIVKRLRRVVAILRDQKLPQLEQALRVRRMLNSTVQVKAEWIRRQGRWPTASIPDDEVSDDETIARYTLDTESLDTPWDASQVGQATGMRRELNHQLNLWKLRLFGDNADEMAADAVAFKDWSRVTLLLKTGLHRPIAWYAAPGQSTFNRLMGLLRERVRSGDLYIPRKSIRAINPQKLPAAVEQTLQELEGSVSMARQPSASRNSDEDSSSDDALSMDGLEGHRDPDWGMRVAERRQKLRNYVSSLGDRDLEKLYDLKNPVRECNVRAVGVVRLRGGFGSARLKGKAVYVGGFEAGTAHGLGQMVDSAGIYEGQLREGIQHGLGRWTLGSGDTYTGSFGPGRGTPVNPYQSGNYGRRRHRHPDMGIVRRRADLMGNRYRRGNPDGGGTITFADGSTYTGTMKQGRVTGYGVFKRIDGVTMEGNFLNGQLDGPGRRVNRDGSIDVGFWRNGEQIRVGRTVYLGGDEFIGEYQRGIQNGAGRYTTGDGRTTYIGNWESGVRSGRGVLRHASHTAHNDPEAWCYVLEGSWKAGLPRPNECSSTVFPSKYYHIQLPRHSMGVIEDFEIRKPVGGRLNAVGMGLTPAVLDMGEDTSGMVIWDKEPAGSAGGALAVTQQSATDAGAAVEEDEAEDMLRSVDTSFRGRWEDGGLSAEELQEIERDIAAAEKQTALPPSKAAWQQHGAAAAGRGGEERSGNDSAPMFVSDEDFVARAEAAAASVGRGIDTMRVVNETELRAKRRRNKAAKMASGTSVQQATAQNARTRASEQAATRAERVARATREATHAMANPSATVAPAISDDDAIASFVDLEASMWWSRPKMYFAAGTQANPAVGALEQPLTRALLRREQQFADHKAFSGREAEREIGLRNHTHEKAAREKHARFWRQTRRIWKGMRDEIHAEMGLPEPAGGMDAYE